MHWMPCSIGLLASLTIFACLDVLCVCVCACEYFWSFAMISTKGQIRYLCEAGTMIIKTALSYTGKQVHTAHIAMSLSKCWIKIQSQYKNTLPMNVCDKTTQIRQWMIRYFCFVSYCYHCHPFVFPFHGCIHSFPILCQHISMLHICSSIFGYMCFSILFYLFLYLFCLITNVIVAVGDMAVDGVTVKWDEQISYIYIYMMLKKMKKQSHATTYHRHIIITIIISCYSTKIYC